LVLATPSFRLRGAALAAKIGPVQPTSMYGRPVVSRVSFLERFWCARDQFIGVGSESMSMRGPIDPLLRATPVERHDIDIAALFGEHRRRLLGVAAAITLDRALAEEIVQDAFAGLQRHSERVENPVGYLQRSVVNISLKQISRRRVAARHPVMPDLPASTAEIDETWTLVVALPANQRAVVVLRFWQDMTVDAIAEMLGWPAGSVKSTLHRALKQLKEELP
jgi:RNA polymerase sigma factor (sigma-70 family)